MIFARRVRSASACLAHGPDHAFVEIDVLDLDVRHLDAPGVGV